MASRASRSGRRAADDFLRRIREVYKLIVDAELGDAWTGGDSLTIGYRMTRYSRRSQPAPLSNGMYLNVQIGLQVTRSPTRLHTTQATFTYQAGADRDDPRPVFEYHFEERDSRSGYPRCHLHVHAKPMHYTPEKPFSRLHLPTRRLTLEQIVWHLIQEHGVKPHRADWREVLWRHEEWFRDIQRDEDWPYDPPFDPSADIRRVRGATTPTG